MSNGATVILFGYFFGAMRARDEVASFATRPPFWPRHAQTTHNAFARCLFVLILAEHVFRSVVKG